METLLFISALLGAAYAAWWMVRNDGVDPADQVGFFRIRAPDERAAAAGGTDPVGRTTPGNARGAAAQQAAAASVPDAGAPAAESGPAASALPGARRRRAPAGPVRDAQGRLIERPVRPAVPPEA